MKPDHAEAIHKEVEKQIDNKDKTNPDQVGREENCPLETGEDELTEQPVQDQPEMKEEPHLMSKFIKSVQFWKKKDHKMVQREVTSRKSVDEIQIEEGMVKPEEEPVRHGLGKQCLIIFKIFVNSFGLIFLAEWGDRSQLATIVLASVNDVGGIILGSVAGHTLCTSLAVLAGALVAKKISVRAITVIGGCVFIGFAIATIIFGFEDPITTQASSLNEVT